MQTKLTLRISEELIKKAKAHAQKSGKSVSQLVSDYFEILDQPNNSNNTQITPIVESLSGILKNKSIDESDYKTYLEEKYL